MTGTLIINGLASLLVIFSLGVIFARKNTTSAIFFSLQSLALVLLFIAMAQFEHAHELMTWAIIAFITKVILIPIILYRLPSHSKETSHDSIIKTSGFVAIAIVIVAIAFFITSRMPLPIVQNLNFVSGLAFGQLFLGLFCIVSRKNILKAIFGYCLMENGLHLTLAMLASNLPEIAETSIAIDTLLTVIIMVVIARKIHRTLNTLDVRWLTILKG